MGNEPDNKLKELKESRKGEGVLSHVSDEELAAFLKETEANYVNILTEARSRGFIIQKLTIENIDKTGEVIRENVSTVRDAFVPGSVTTLYTKILPKEEADGSEES